MKDDDEVGFRGGVGGQDTNMDTTLTLSAWRSPRPAPAKALPQICDDSPTSPQSMLWGRGQLTVGAGYRGLEKGDR